MHQNQQLSFDREFLVERIACRNLKWARHFAHGFLKQGNLPMFHKWMRLSHKWVSTLRRYRRGTATNSLPTGINRGIDCT